MKVERFTTNPIIKPNMKGNIESNINGPSLIKAPDWLPHRLGKYYLYFAHHKGNFIRLAYAENLEGSWKIYEPGTLKLEDSFCQEHIASPDVHVDEGKHEIRMYYHGVMADGRQRTKVAVSQNGVDFTCSEEELGNSYFRVILWEGYYYALGMPGIFYRSRDGLTSFDRGPTLFDKNMRHCALKLCGNTLYVFYSHVGDTPECILLATIELTPDWMNWHESQPMKVLVPEMEYEGVDLPLEPSVRGWAPERVRQLRDPAIYEEGDNTYLLYSVAGEHGLAIAKLTPNSSWNSS